MPEPAARPLWTAAEVAAATGGALHGDDRPIGGLTYNSREIAPGDLFLALKGARDGHEFAAAAFQAGAAQAFIVQLVTQRLDEVQVAAGIGAEPDNVAGIGRYFRLEQDHVKHAQHRG